MKEMISYHFEAVAYCEMCSDPTGKHKILGQRLNTSQGMRPRRKSGITVSIKKCRNCRLIYSSPLPVPFDIQDHYGIPPESYWHAGYFVLDPNYFAGEIKTARTLLDFKPGMRSLDIGAGIGKCMIALKNAGFDAWGFEPSKPYYERALSKMNIPPDRLRLGMVEEMEYEPGSFDFITFGAVFEHLYHPAASLEKAFRWLKPGGVIHIEVPSSKYLASKMVNFYYRLIGTNYVSNLSPMHVPFHLYEFGYDSFKALSTKI
jgi:2-polyprenyl-3-methyl-5-hydroxy-6-metoxy-1,4-benzoquinol methylase